MPQVFKAKTILLILLFFIALTWNSGDLGQNFHESLDNISGSSRNTDEDNFDPQGKVRSGDPYEANIKPQGRTSIFPMPAEQNHPAISCGYGYTPPTANINLSSKYPCQKSFQSYIEHGPISIDGNNDFLIQNSTEPWTGAGTKEDPLIIEGFNITTTDINFFPISIRNTDLYFEIHDCLLIGKAGAAGGTVLENTTHTKIKDNIANGSWGGIHAVYSPNNTISGNILSSNLEIYLDHSSDDNIISNNIASDMVLSDSNRVTIFNNTIDQIISLFNTSNNAVTSNRVGRIRIQYSNFANIAQNTINTTKISIPETGIYLEDSFNNSLLGNNISGGNRGIELASSGNSTISSNSITNTWLVGIELSNSSNSKITGNTLSNIQKWTEGTAIEISSSKNCTINNNYITDCSRHGIHLEADFDLQTGSDHALIRNNTISGCGRDGIRLMATSYCNISSNKLAENAFYGLFMGAWDTDIHNSTNNIVQWNEFVGNNADENCNSQAGDEGESNIFEYNYWDDWITPDGNYDGIVDHPYDIEGFQSASTNQDPFPRVFPFRDHAPILIDGNTDFLNQKNLEGWAGTGSVADPIVIGGYRIKGPLDRSLIFIRDTDLCFRISNCWLVKATNNGIDIAATSASVATISNNVISVDDGGAIHVYYMENVLISDNIIWGVPTEDDAPLNSNGIVLQHSDNNILKNNKIATTHEFGIILYSSNNNTISGNMVTNGITWGISLDHSSFNVISNNNITYIQSPEPPQFDRGRGISVRSHSDSNIISSNSVASCSSYCISLDSSSDNCVVKRNSFIGNNPTGISQAADEGVGNTFEYNYWDDWTSPDNDYNGFVDNPYLIEGNQDPYPLVWDPINAPVHELSVPTVVYPNGGEVVSGVIEIRWLASEDSIHQSVFYDLYYSSSRGTTWELLAGNLTSNAYYWNTSTVPDGVDYLIKVAATCFYGLTTEDTSDQIFSVNNIEETTQTQESEKETEIIPGWEYLIEIIAFGVLFCLLKKQKGSIKEER